MPEKSRGIRSNLAGRPGSPLASWQHVLRAWSPIGLSVAIAVSAAPAASAQDDGQADRQPMHDMATMEPPPPSWTWMADGNVFYGYNKQQRHFASLSAWESQNWFMGAGEHALGPGRLTLQAMLSLEPFTIQPQGSPQLFQTGESYQRVPLVDFQHPHDLLMNLTGSYRYSTSAATYDFSGGLVGAPALGPTAFMHRESSRDNPQVPLTHHSMDDTHISWGVVTAGVEKGEFTLEASGFRGEEPDEDHTNIERPRIDSYSARLSWRRGPWAAQFSGGRLHEPEWFEPYDQTRLTASVEFNGTVRARPVSATFGWGENRESIVRNGVSDNFLTEWDVRAAWATAIYGRAEIVEKQILGLGYHSEGEVYAEVYSHVDVLTIGAIHDVLRARWARVGIGADVTLYHLSPDVQADFEGSHSYHVFARWRPNAAPMHHMH
jgi:hypothetical protein